MASLWMMELDGVTAERYEDLRRRVNWEGDVPAGLQLHVAAFDERGLVLTELWESPELLQKYMEERFVPVVESMQVEGQPGVELYEAYTVFTPAYRPA